VRDIEAAPIGSVIWTPRRAALDKRDRVAADDELEADLIASMFWDAAVAELFNLANGGEFDQLGKRHQQRSRSTHEVPNAGATPHVSQK
jgi:hypothetical protein